MQIRTKRILLLTTIAVVPALAVAALYGVSSILIGRELAAMTRQALLDEAMASLEVLVTDYNRIVRRDRAIVVQALKRQVYEVEGRLANAAPIDPVIFTNSDYKHPDTSPKDLRVDPLYRKHRGEKTVPIAVSFSQQVYIPIRQSPTLSADMARLSSMPAVYEEFRQLDPSLFFWLYTALESGFHSCHPGHGDYPEDYSPFVREWYAKARDKGDVVWTLLPGVSSRTVTLTASAPVHDPNGRFAGVTAVDLRIPSLLDRITLPAPWRNAATVVLATPEVPGGTRDESLIVFAGKDYERQGRQWRQSIRWEELTSSNAQTLAAFRRTVLSGRPSTARMPYRGVDSLWAHSAWREGSPVAVVIVPFKHVVAEAAQAAQLSRQRTAEGLILAGVVIGVLLLAAVAAAVISARSVTRPVYELTGAARRLAAGDFEAKVAIDTRDELQELGEVFNSVGPRLREHQEMARALATAREIQRHLLPQAPPALPGFDVAGRYLTCDETGGDYYDFIELEDLGAGKIGIAIGDVTGHGIGAALLMASARSALRSQVVNDGDHLVRIFSRLNRHLFHDTASDRFMTLFYGLLDSEARTIKWISGGHDPAIRFRAADGSVEELSTGKGLPLGVLEESTFEQAGPMRLHSGDVIVLGTDGIWEARNGNEEEFGRKRLCDTIVEAHGRGAGEICDIILDRVVEWIGAATRADDITVVVVKAL